MKLEGGFRTLNFMDQPFIGDVDCPYGSIYLSTRPRSSLRYWATSPRSMRMVTSFIG